MSSLPAGKKHSAVLATKAVSRLQSQGIEQKTAASYAQLLVDIFHRIQADKELQERLLAWRKWLDLGHDSRDFYKGAVKVEQVTKYIRNAQNVGLESAQLGFKMARMGGVAHGLDGFIGLFEAAAEANNIKLADWCLSVSKIAVVFAEVLAAGAFAPEILSLEATLILFTVGTESYKVGKALIR